MTEAGYLAFDRESEIKHEFIDGRVYAMSGASEAHNLIAGSIYVSLYTQLRGRPCKVYASDMKVRTPSTRSYTYPDISVVCDDAEFDGDSRDILLNPTVVIEVLSPNTERFDRGRKFQRYRELESLQEYVLVAQDSPHVERFARQDNGLWQLSEVHGLQASLSLTSIACALRLADIYEQIDFDSGESAASSES
jgi:Uma2 family endonuclease